MLSPISRTPLNSTAATVSSSTHFSASSSSSSPFQATSKQKQKKNSGLSSPVISSSQCPPFLSLFIVIFFSYLMCHTTVFSAPFYASTHSVSGWKHDIHSGKHSKKENLIKDNQASSHDDMPQNDQPPRDRLPSNTVPESWIRPPQKRIYYLRAENDQFLQFNGYTVTGTKEPKPILGLVRFLSHEQSLVIVGFHENKYLCMNSTYALYLSDTINHECYINELSLFDRGSYATAYDFIKYKKDKKLYLGIDCDPMLGIATNLSIKATRFIRLDINEEEAAAARAAIQMSGPEKHAKEKCKTPYEIKRAAKKRRQKLRNRWCWNIDRIIANRTKYMEHCRERESDTCDKRFNGGNSEECVCDILERMINNTKRTKRKCLIEKLTKWVKNQNKTSNSQAILETSRLLLPSYSGIARRMRTLKSKQSTTRTPQGQEVSNVNKNKHEMKSTHHTSTEYRKNISRCPEGTKRRGQGCRDQAIKIKLILEKYNNELILSHDMSSSENTSPRTFTTKDVSFSTSSVLSKEFKDVLNSLNNAHPKRHKNEQRKKRLRKSRLLKESKIRSGRQLPAHSRRDSRPAHSRRDARPAHRRRNSRIAGSVSPG